MLVRAAAFIAAVLFEGAATIAQGNDAAPPAAITTPARPLGQTHDCSDSYPHAARDRGEMGFVYIVFDVDVAGTITNVTIAKSSGFAELDAAALKCVADKWRDTPALVGTTPVPSPGHRAAISFWIDEDEDARYFDQAGQGLLFTSSSETALRNAIRDFDRAIDLDSDFKEAYRHRGLAYQRLGDPEHARADFDKAGKTPAP